MPTLQVHALRKEKRLAEAYEMAVNDLEQEDSTWTRGALFWVLYDMFKACAPDEADRRTSLADQMSELYENGLNDEKGFARKALDRIKRQLTIENSLIRKAEELSKNGNEAEAYHIILPLLETTIQDEADKTSIGWILYRYIKVTHSEPEAFCQYLSLGIQKQPLLHSLLLFLLLDKDRNVTPQTKSLLEGFGFDDFSADDWKRKGEEHSLAEGLRRVFEKSQVKWEREKEYPSLVERFIKKYMDSLEASADSTPGTGFDALLSKAIERFPDNKELPRYLAIIHIASGDLDSALREYREILRKNPGKYYLWEELASIAKDKDLRISALCKAIVMQPKDEFLVNVRLSLADELIEKGLFAEALCELDRYALTCERNSWPKKRAYNELVSRIPEGTQPAKDNSSFYEAHTAAYKEFIYSDIPWTPMAIAAIFSKVGKNGKQEEMAKLISRDGRILTIRVKCLLGISQPKVGLCLDVKLKRKDGWNEAILTRLSEVSLDEIVSEEVGVVDNVNEVKRLFHCVLENDKDVTVYFKDTALRPVVGDVMMVRSYRDVNREGVARYRAIDIRIDNSIRTSLLREFEGMAEVKTGTNGNKYCFIDGVYIPGHLLKGLGEWIQAKGKAIKTKRGWTAVALYSTKTLCRIDHC